MSLRERLIHNRLVMVDEKRELTLVWYGGFGMHAFRDDGTEAAYWTLMSNGSNDAKPAAVRKDMSETIAQGSYP